MHRFRVFAQAALVTTLTALAAPAWSGPITLTFNLNTPNGNPVTDLVIYNGHAGVDSIQFVPDVLAPNGVQTLTYSVPFDPTSTLILGINPAADAEGAHIILFAEETFANNAVGKKWSELFAPARHNAMITLVSDAHDGNAAAIASLTDFFRGPKAAAAAFHSPDSYSILQFSTVRPPIGSPVPEPGSVLLFGAGLFVLWIARRRFAR